MVMTTLPFGTTSHGENAHLYLLSNERGMTVVLTDVGASVVSVRVPDARGDLLDVALGHAGVRGYEEAIGLMGATVGRVANRTADACFELDGCEYQLAQNEGKNNNHSGPDLWCNRLWEVTETGEQSVTFVLASPDGDQGFPGALDMRVTYEVTDDDRLVVRQEGTPTARTPMNLTNHAYWNLDGHVAGNILGHTLSVLAGGYLPTHPDNIPVGEVATVEGTCFDLRSGRVLSNALADLPYGYDHCFCLDNEGAFAPVARLVGERSGIVMDVLTDAPGLQVYMAGWLDDPHGKDGVCYGQFAGVALEAQHWPDAIHHPEWPSPVYGPERPFSQTTVFAFTTV